MPRPFLLPRSMLMGPQCSPRRFPHGALASPTRPSRGDRRCGAGLGACPSFPVSLPLAAGWTIQELHC